MKIKWLESCGSTNEEMKKALVASSEELPAIAALEQTCGRGRMGRSFFSPKGSGLYISFPIEVPSMDEALSIMPMAAVCVCLAIKKLCGVSCQIKWPNDVIYHGRKLCGILTELVPQAGRGNKPDMFYLILGIGINLSLSSEFPESLKDTAVSLAQICANTYGPKAMAEALLPYVEDLITVAGRVADEPSAMGKEPDSDAPKSRRAYLDFYRRSCTTTGRDVTIVFSEGSRPMKAKSLEITEDYGLLVQWEDGKQEVLRNGEVSVRNGADKT